MTAFADLIEQQAKERTDAGSFLFLDARGRETSALSWIDLAARTRAIAAGLLAQGLAGKRVCILCPWGEAFVLSLWGCLYAGVVPVPAPLDTFERSVGRARAIVDAARPAAAIATEETRAFVARVAPSVPVLTVGDLLRSDTGAMATSGNGQLALLQFTSGSTSQPRGVALSADNVLANCRAIIATYGLTPADVGVSWLPLHHDMGLIGHALVPVLVGLRSVLMPSLGFLQRPERWLQVVDRYRGTISSAPNFAYEYCVRRAKADGASGLDLACWRVAICGAEPVDAATLDGFAARFAPIGFDRRAFRPSYGLAEATLLVSAGGGEAGPLAIDVDGVALGNGVVAEVTGLEPRRLVSCGRPATGVEILIVDPATGRAVDEHRTGDIVVRSGGVAMGYFEALGERMSQLPAPIGSDGDGWFRTGDVGFWRAGELYVIGRGDDTIQVRGRNVHASEVEAVAARAHPALTPGSCAAFGVRSEGTSGIVLVAEVPRVGAPPEAVLLAVREGLSRSLDLVPEDILLVPSGSLPRTTSGKVRRSACLAHYVDGTWSTSIVAALPPQRAAAAGAGSRRT